MNKFRFTLKILAIATFVFAFASMTQAQATRTWVSGVGDDVNPCSRTAPCKTFAGAISKTATGGEIDALDPGGFGAVTVNKSLTIDGTTGSGFGSILAALTTGVIINDNTHVAVVNLRNLSIQGTGPTGINPGTNGIRFLDGKSLTVENCYINGFTAASTNGNGILVSMPAGATATEVYVRNTTISNCRVGVSMTAAAGFVSGTFDNVKISHMVASGGGAGTDGIALLTNAFAEVRDSTISFAPGSGITITGAGTQVSIVNTMIQHCGTGINAGGTSTNRITHSQILLNGTGVNFAGGILRSFGDNVYDGNVTPFAGGAISPQGQQ